MYYNIYIIITTREWRAIFSYEDIVYKCTHFHYNICSGVLIDLTVKYIVNGT